MMERNVRERYINIVHDTSTSSIRHAGGDIRPINAESATFRVAAEACSTGTYPPALNEYWYDDFLD
jgi:hypothetical protein